jgi:acyl-CoA reductase-like NAD-dependent aldehyde dehydrogenase
MESFPLLIHGAGEPDDFATATAPYDGAPMARVALANADHVELALTTAHDLYLDRDAWLGVPQRVAILEKAMALMQERVEELALESAQEGGKPLVDSRVEVLRAIDGLKIAVEVITGHTGKVVPMNISAASSNRMAMTQKEPIGVVVAVSAFNHPLNLIVHQVGAAVAAGCPVIVKPAGDTPLMCLRFVQTLHQAGLPPSWCQAVIIDDKSLATGLVTDRRVAFFSFIGSASVGWSLRSKLAPGTRCALEHGGVAPVIVAQDADLQAAVPALLKGGLYHAGQVCVSVQRIYAHASIARDLAERLAQGAGELTVGDPRSADTDVGPLIRPAEVVRVHDWVREAVAEGAELLSGGEPISDSCYPCTVLYNPSDDSKVSRLEVFGPVICVYPFEELDQAIRRANRLDVSFQAAVFTTNIDTALRAYRRLNASAVMVNDHTAFRVDGMPFAGLKHSGLGTGGIPYTIEDMQVDKMVVWKSNEL